MQVITGNMDCTSKHCTKKYTTEVVDKVVSPRFERWKRDSFAARFWFIEWVGREWNEQANGKMDGQESSQQLCNQMQTSKLGISKGLSVSKWGKYTNGFS